METSEATVQTEVTACPQFCKCAKCKQVIQDKFHPFRMEPWGHKWKNQIANCPTCERPCYAKARSSWFIWSCWECLAIEASVIKVISGGENKTYGFAETKDNEPIYFHFNRQARVEFDGGNFPHLVEVTENFQTPDMHDVLLLQPIMGDKGRKALWWVFEIEYSAILKQIQTRPKLRLRRRTGKVPMSRLHEKPSFSTLWEGYDLNELRSSRYASLECHDTAISAVFFEMFKPETDSWVPCDDPLK